MRIRAVPAVLLLSAFLLSGPPLAATARAQAAQPQAAAASPAAVSEASVRGHMEFLASDALQGRGSGTRDEWIAAEYIAAQLRRWGLEPLGDEPADGEEGVRSFVQTVEMRAVETTAPPTLVAGGLTLTHGKEMLVEALGTIAHAAGPLHMFADGTVVPTGAIVLMTAAPIQPRRGMSEDERAAYTAQRDALAPASVIVYPETPAIREGWAKAAAELPSAAPRPVDLPAIASRRPTMIAVDTSSHAALAGLASRTSALFNAETVWGDTPTYTWNVVGRLSGAGEERAREILLLSAHLDHVGRRENAPGDDKIYNGADDDASGSVAVLELARVLAAGPAPERTIVFAWFGSEERGGTGSNFFAETESFLVRRIVANLQFEMIGRPDPKVPPQTLWLTGYERSNLGEALAAQGARLVADPHPDQSFFTRSDNIRFARKGIPAHTVSSFGLHTDYHQPGDEIAKIDFAHMTEAIRSLVAPIRWLANDPFRPDWAPGGRPR